MKELVERIVWAQFLAVREDGSHRSDEAAAILATKLRSNPTLRAEVAAYMIVQFEEPFFSDSRPLFRRHRIEEAVHDTTPSATLIQRVEESTYRIVAPENDRGRQ